MSQTQAAEDFHLSEEALKQFDAEFRDWPPYQQLMTDHIQMDKIQTVLDVGGGSGSFMDNLLELCPKAEGHLLDYSDFMLERNKAHPRKHLKQGSATDLDTLFPDQKFDLVTINVLLHHLVASSESTTRDMLLACFNSLQKVLSPTGHVVVYEQIYDGFVPMVEPGSLIYRLTRIRNPLFAKFIGKMGANTAGIGVRFRSRDNWTQLFKDSSFEIAAEQFAFVDSPPIHWRLALNIRHMGSYLYLLKKR